MLLPEKGYKRIIVITFYVFLTILIGCLFFKYLFSCILPFATAFIIATSTRKSILFITKKLKVSRFFAVLVTTLLLLGAVLALIYYLFRSVFTEISGLASYLSTDNIKIMFESLSGTVFTFIEKNIPGFADELIPTISSLSQNIQGLIISSTETALPYVASAALGIIKTLPKILMFSGVALLSLFYFGCDYEKITAFITEQFSLKQQKFIYELKNQFLSTIVSTMRAYFILILITFAELLTGFLIIGIPYSTILAVVISLIDILPVLGTGTVLIPWSIFLFISGDVKNGLCILVLYVIITVVRQIAEPKIIGSSLGLPPLVTLMSMYFGVKLAGISGLFVFPFTVIIIKNLNEKGYIHLYKNSEVLNENIKK